MERRTAQAPSAVVMIRPHHFGPNKATVSDNSFQASADRLDPTEVSKAAYDEATIAAQILKDYGVRVHLFEDEGDLTPDSVFPNNWFSTHPGGHVALFPMCVENRRLERRHDIIEMLKKEYRVQDVIDYSGLEVDEVFLEGTGAMVLDHMDRIAYAARSGRTDPIALERFCTHFNYEPMAFDAVDMQGRLIYHTNILMCIATDFSLICSGLITCPDRRREIVTRLSASGRDVLHITNEQSRKFAGNAIELQGTHGRLLALSSVAYASLGEEQRATISKSATLLPISIPTIELAGGSVRCMIAGIHLTAR